ncbi:MAG TPA: Hpt domain-containing protein [Silvibacterium sp.]|jgi:HPt (histidine-containing phosphotransfer) domain-containing protein|nr:Hpt domain-containing protein [Silvibacterium sp.]
MSETSDPRAQELEVLLQTLWKNNYATILERLKTLRDVQKGLAIGPLDNQTRQNAEAAAHKLAGVLGTFGLPEGSKLASKVEVLLAQESSPGPESGAELEAWLDKLEALVASKR